MSDRHSIDVLLEELWKDPQCAASLQQVVQAALATAQDSVFSDYLRAVLNDLIYLLRWGPLEGWR